MKIRLSTIYMMVTIFFLMVYGTLSFLGIDIRGIDTAIIYTTMTIIMMVISIYRYENFVSNTYIALDSMSKNKTTKEEEYDVPPIPPPPQSINNIQQPEVKQETTKIETSLDNVQVDKKAEAIAEYILEKIKSGLDIRTIFGALIDSNYDKDYLTNIINQMIKQGLIQIQDTKKEEPKLEPEPQQPEIQQPQVQVEVPKKRKRGRPRKIQNETDNTTQQ